MNGIDIANETIWVSSITNGSEGASSSITSSSFIKNIIQNLENIEMEIEYNYIYHPSRRTVLYGCFYVF